MPEMGESILNDSVGKSFSVHPTAEDDLTHGNAWNECIRSQWRSG